MRTKGTFVLTLLVLMASAAWAVEAPVAVSPGSDEGQAAASIGDTCPTFSWGAADGAVAYSVAVYKSPSAEGATPVIDIIIDAEALSWTPSAAECLAAGSGYEWYVGATGAAGDEAWSAAKMFTVTEDAVAAAGDVGAQVLANNEVLSAHIREADGTFGQDPNIGSGIKTRHLQDDAVTSLKIKNYSVKAWDLGPESVTTGKIRDGNVNTVDIADSAVTGAKIANDSITSHDIADGTIGTVDLADGGVTSADLADGGIGTVDLADGAVTTSKLAYDSVSGGKIINGTIVTEDIADGAVTSANIASGGVTSANIASGGVTTSNIADGTIATADLNLTSVDARYVNATGDTMTGSLGIGTAPADSLDVNGDIRLRGGDIKDTGGTSRIQVNDNGDLYLMEDGGAISVTVNTLGYVGIGTTAPADSLDVNGDIRLRGQDIKDTGGTSRIQVTDNGNLILKEDGGAAALTVSTTGTVSAASTLTAASMVTTNLDVNGSTIYFGTEEYIEDGGSSLITTGTNSITQDLASNGLVKAWARINSNGTVASCWNCNTSTLETRQLGTGQYEVDFTPIGTDISARARMAMQNGTVGHITTLDSSDLSSVRVNTYKTSLSLSNRAFTIIIY
jgi:hypothetical protein